VCIKFQRRSAPVAPGCIQIESSRASGARPFIGVGRVIPDQSGRGPTEGKFCFCAVFAVFDVTPWSLSCQNRITLSRIELREESSSFAQSARPRELLLVIVGLRGSCLLAAVAPTLDQKVGGSMPPWTKACPFSSKTSTASALLHALAQSSSG